MKLAPALLALLLSAAVRAEAPMVTEHSDPLAVGECELGLLVERLRSPEGRERGWSSYAGCGLLPELDLGLGLGRWRSEGERSRSLELYGRWRLRDGGDAGTSVGLVFGLEAQRRPGERLRHDTSTLLLAVDRPLGPGWLARLNLGRQHSRLQAQSSSLWALGLERELSESLVLVAETYGQSRSKPWQGLGLRWLPAEAWSFGLMGSRSRGQRGWLFSAQWVG